jgi:8-oxo-dGTP diphosphatase
MAHEHTDFVGAKLVLFLGPRLLVLQRDDRPGLLWPGFWDLPGGGREAKETPLACALRETREESGLTVPPSQIRWGRAYTNSIGRTVWFFAGSMSEETARSVRLGEEGQGWDLFSPQQFNGHDKAVPQFKERLQDYLAGVRPYPLQKDPPLAERGEVTNLRKPARRGVSPDISRVDRKFPST